MEEEVSINNEKKYIMHKRKWHQVKNVLKNKTI